MVLSQNLESPLSLFKECQRTKPRPLPPHTPTGASGTQRVTPSHASRSKSTLETMSRCESRYALGTSQSITVWRLKQKKGKKNLQIPACLQSCENKRCVVPPSFPARSISFSSRCAWWTWELTNPGLWARFLRELSPRGPAAICGLRSDPFSTAQEAKDLGLSGESGGKNCTAAGASERASVRPPPLTSRLTADVTAEWRKTEPRSREARRRT